MDSGEATKKFISEEALKSFISEGYEKTSLSVISERCNVTKGAIYHHFKSKDGLFTIAIDLFHEDYETWLNKRLKKAKNIKEFLYIFFDYGDYFSTSKFFDGTSVNFYRLMFDATKRFPDLKKLLVERYISYVDIIESRLIKAKKENIIEHFVDCRATAMEIIVLFEGFMLLDVLSGDSFNFVEVSNNIFENIWRRVVI